MNSRHHINSYIAWIHTFHVNSYIVWIPALCLNSYIKWIHTLHVNSYIVWISTLLAQFFISGYDYLSLPLEQRRWQKWFCFCPSDGNLHHHCPWSMNTRACGLHLACNHFVQHDGFRSSCGLSKSKNKNKNKSVTEIWNKIDSFFQMNCRRSRKRTGHYAWPHCSFSWSDCACNHPSCHRTWCFSRPCCCIKRNCGVNCLDDDSRIVDHCGCVGCFDGSSNIYDCNVDGSLIHGYVRQEVEPFSFPLAACPWQSSQEHQPPCWLLDSAQRKQSSWAGK